MIEDEKILIVAATKEEIIPLKKKYPFLNYLIAGIGIPSFSYQLTKKLLQTPFDIVINLGIAGSFNPLFKNGDIIFVKEECFADLGIEDDMDFIPISKTSFTEQDYSFKNSFKHSFLKNIPNAKSISVCKTSGNEKTIAARKKMFNPDIENMEGAVFFQICQNEKIPFVEIRAISNPVTKRDKSLWNIPLAIENLNTFAIKFIEELIKKPDEKN